MGEENEPNESNEPKTYTQEEFDTLKDEAIKNRKKAARADTFRDAYRDAVLKDVCAGVLVEPLPWDDSYDDPETGLPDAERIKAAAQELALSKPHLARVQPIPQGPVGEKTDTVDLAGILRAGA